MITLDEARDRIGDGVVYQTRYGNPEDGVIVNVNDEYVMVRYAGDQHAKATRPDNLVFLSPKEKGTK